MSCERSIGKWLFLIAGVQGPQGGRFSHFLSAVYGLWLVLTLYEQRMGCGRFLRCVSSAWVVAVSHVVLAAYGSWPFLMSYEH